MRFPDRIAAEFLAEEALQQDLAHRLERGVGQQHFEPAAAILHVDAQPRQHRGIGRPADGGEARIGLEPVEAESHRAQRIEGAGQIGQHDRDQALDQVALDRGIGPALDAHRRRAAAAAQQHVDDRIDQRAVDGEEAVIVPFLGLEHAQHRRQRDRVEIVAEADRGDVVDRHLDIVGGEVAQRGRHHAHEAVEHDLEHRQTLVGDERRIDDRADAGSVVGLAVAVAEAEQAVDLVLIENACRCRRSLAVVAPSAPPVARRLRVGLALRSCGRFFAIVRASCRLLNQHFLEQHVVDLDRATTALMRASSSSRSR